MGEQKSGEKRRKKDTGIATVARRAFDKLADDRMTHHFITVDESTFRGTVCSQASQLKITANHHSVLLFLEDIQ